ncbi:P-loop containing nucleoside triphosphate hydrolase protein [Helicostylum pulchrum]|uniref:EngB-type G domain-containing protein n=1 Tax=Helicostylum pulchrum TaxID=562976 RepID=A0ABP9Y1T6_9FUNG|nr:P-loop containing nucleoside triphosphate hydrolase protein [Helicostylum pulchrum]
MQHYKPVLSIVKRLGLIEPKVLLRPFVSVATTNAPSTELSNRQKFNQIAPPVKLYEKLEKLGFGTLLKTKRFAGVHKQKAKRDQQRLQHTERVGPPPEPKYAFPLLSFFAGAKVPTSFPPESLDEIAFVGRSNVGKSSLINSLAESSVVRTSDKPGLTQQINFFNVGKLFHMIDMPGYGFAFVDEAERETWRELMETYVSQRKTLKRVYVVLDARHGVKVADTEFLGMLNSKQVKFQVVLTKCDLLVLPNLARRIVTIEEHLKPLRNAVKDVVVVSSKTDAGINQFRKEMLFLMGHLKPKEFYDAIQATQDEKEAKRNKAISYKR